MTISLTTPVTGLAQTGLTTPTYTVVVDTPPDSQSKQWAVTALGGTQPSVRSHSSSDPFTFTARRPAVFQALGKPNPTTNVIKFVPLNRFRLKTRKGVYPLAGQASTPSYIDTDISVPAGSDIADPNNLMAGLSFHFGCVSQQSAGIGDTARTGIL